MKRWHGILCVVASLVALRVAYVWIMPERACNVADWKFVAMICKALDKGISPYEWGWNHPPQWIGWCTLFNLIAHCLHIHPVTVARALLIACDASICLLVWNALGRDDKAERWAFYGVAVNPILVFLSCQQGNQDGLLTLYLFGAVTLLRRNWTVACLLVGAAISLKLIAFVVLPLLLVDATRRTITATVFGMSLALLPALVSLTAVGMLHPVGLDTILHYRSIAGRFGITGLTENFGMQSATVSWMRLFPWALCLLLAGQSVAVAQREMSRRSIYVLMAFNLLAVPILGPAFSPQYLLWCLPFLLVLAGRGVVRLPVLVAFGIASLTYLQLYAWAYPHGAFLLNAFPIVDGWMLDVREYMRTITWEARPLTMLTLPMFAACCWVLMALWKERRTE